MSSSCICFYEYKIPIRCNIKLDANDTLKHRRYFINASQVLNVRKCHIEIWEHFYNEIIKTSP